MNLKVPDSSDVRPRFTHELVLRVTVPGEPIPKQRPRVLRSGRTYTPARTKDAQLGIAWEVVRQRANESTRLPPKEYGPLAMTCRFYRGTGRTADLDNLVKLVKDALNGVVWKDDRQVTQLHASRFDRQPNPRTEIEVYRIIECAR